MHSRLLKFCVKNSAKWTFLGVLGLLFATLHPTSFSIILFLFGFGSIICYVVSLIRIFAGTLIDGRQINVTLPCLYSETIRIKNPEHLIIIFFVENRSFVFLYGEILIKDSSGITVNRMNLPEQKGIKMKGLFGPETRGGPSGKSYLSKRVEKIFINTSMEQELTIEINLDWNFQGWNSHWEREIPKDKKLSLEWQVRACPKKGNEATNAGEVPTRE